jgi:hypothetical protein
MYFMKVLFRTGHVLKNMLDRHERESGCQKCVRRQWRWPQLDTNDTCGAVKCRPQHFSSIDTVSSCPHGLEVASVPAPDIENVGRVPDDPSRSPCSPGKTKPANGVDKPRKLSRTRPIVRGIIER